MQISTEFWGAVRADGRHEDQLGAGLATAGKAGSAETLECVGLYRCEGGVVTLTHVMTPDQAMGLAVALKDAAVAAHQARTGVAS